MAGYPVLQSTGLRYLRMLSIKIVVIKTTIFLKIIFSISVPERCWTIHLTELFMFRTERLYPAVKKNNLITDKQVKDTT